jgi:hypothetical protein
MGISFFRLAILSTLALLVSCTATGPADDGWETSDGFKKGDGLFSGAKGGYQFGTGEDKSRQQQEGQKQPVSKNNQTSQDNKVKYNTQAPTDYETYLQWRESRDSKSEEYKRFLQWQEFEDYLRWKQSQ